MLVVVPTPFELDLISTSGFSHLDVKNFELCGFGPIAAGINTLRLIQEQAPDRVLLMGIAGRYGAELQIGDAYFFHELSIYGIGAGSGRDFLLPRDMNLPQTEFNGKAVFETIHCGIPRPGEPRRNLLTVAASAGNQDDVAMRLEKFPQAIAEDMEAFSVAMACKMAGVDLIIIRGISNDAGDRDRANWKSKDAMQSALRMYESLL